MSERLGIAFLAFPPMPARKRVPSWVPGRLNVRADERLCNLRWESHQSSLWGLPAAPGEEEKAVSQAGKQEGRGIVIPPGWVKRPTLRRASRLLERGRIRLVLERQGTLLLTPVQKAWPLPDGRLTPLGSGICLPHLKTMCCAGFYKDCFVSMHFVLLSLFFGHKFPRF